MWHIIHGRIQIQREVGGLDFHLEYHKWLYAYLEILVRTPLEKQLDVWVSNRFSSEVRPMWNFLVLAILF